MADQFELKFDLRTIEHLGVKMYSTLPPALAELISNAYDADASKVAIHFHEQNGTPKAITVVDDGIGMSAGDIQNKFLVIGRNRRKEEGDTPTKKYKRLPTGKKGLGKLALFGLAKSITVDTSQAGLRNRFVLDWDSLLSADGTYNPLSELRNKEVAPEDTGTVIRLSGLKRKSPFDLNSLADHLAKIFIVDSGFKIILKSSTPGSKEVPVTNERRYESIKKQFEWSKSDLVDPCSEYYERIEMRLITSEVPIAPSSGLRGVTLFSRGKLINAPEYFSSSTSSHFFQYLTGWIKADFIDLLDDDVISTNRQSVNWDHPEMEKFRQFLAEVIGRTNNSWRKKRSENKEIEFKNKTGIDKGKWLSTLPADVKNSVEKIVDTMSKDEAVSASYEPVMKALHNLVPEYPLLHWRHLHEMLKPRVELYYKNGQYGQAADQGAKIYGELIRSLSGTDIDGTDLASLFSFKEGKHPKLQVADIGTKSGRNLQEGQGHLTRGLMQGFRNPVNHSPIDTIVPDIFSEVDCLNVLSLVSYLMARLDAAKSDVLAEAAHQ
jgi:uncharacterized protein (TIGR02391 family)